jgi:hypothetical protein
MFRVVRALQASLWPDAECQDCEWTHQSNPAARERAKDHVKQTGHSVTVDAITRAIYKRKG